MSDVLEYAREADPRLKSVPDEDLVGYLAETFPNLLEDPEFKSESNRVSRKQSLRKEQTKAKRAGGRAQEAANWLESLQNYGAIPWVNLPRTVSDLSWQAAKAVGMVGNYTGNVTGGLAADLLTGQYPAPWQPNAPALPNLSSALVGGDVQQDVGTSMLNRGLALGAQSLGPIAMGMAGTAAGIPPAAAFAAAMGSTTYAATGDPAKAAESALLGAAMPGVAQGGREVAATVLGSAINRGLLSGERNLTQKAVEALAAQVGIQALFQGASLPEYAAMPPDQRWDAIGTSLIANAAFAGPDALTIMRSRVPSLTLRQMPLDVAAAEVMTRLVNDPAVMEALQSSVDEIVVRNMDPALTGPRFDIANIPKEVKSDEMATVPRQTPETQGPLGPEPAQLNVEIIAPRRENKLPPETITSPLEEGKASEMLAEPGTAASLGATPPGPEAVKRRTIQTERPPDILDYIEQLGSKIRGLKSAKPGSEGFYTEEYRQAVNLSAARKLFSNRLGRPPDEIVDDLRREGLVSQEFTVDNLWDAMVKAAETRKAQRKAPSEESRQLNAEEAKRTDFEQVAIENLRPAHTKGKSEPILVNDLLEGDEFMLAGTKVKVQELIWDPDSAELAYVVLKDGRRFGVQTVSADQLIYPDPGSLFKTEPKIGWVEPEAKPIEPRSLQLEKPESVEEQKARLTAEQAQAETKAARDKMLEEQALRLAAGLIDTTGDLFDPTQADNPLFAVPTPKSASKGASVGLYRSKAVGRAAVADTGPASALPTPRTSGVFIKGIEQPLTGVDQIRPIQFPEMVRIAREITGLAPGLKRFPRAQGMFYAIGAGLIKLHPEVFKTLDQFSSTLAHEIGHLADYLPDRSLDRGNILGRLATLKEFLKATLPIDPSKPLDEILTAKQRVELRRQAEEQVGPRPPKDEEADLAAWQEEVRRVYAERRDEECDRRGLIQEPEIRKEILDLSTWWRPIPDGASEGYIAYRESSQELYADAISVLFNSPGELQARAPLFWKSFFDYLDRKPEVKQKFFELQELIFDGVKPVITRRIEESRSGYMTGRERFMELMGERQAKRDSFDGFWLGLKQEMVDRGDALSRAVRTAERKGVKIEPWADPRNAWEISLFSDNRNYIDVRTIYNEIVKPVEKAGLDLETLGLVLQYQRQIGKPESRQAMESLREKYSAKAEVFTKAVRLLHKMEKAKVGPEVIAAKLIGPLEKLGVDFADVVAYRDAAARAGTRVDLANPQGLQARFAEPTLAQLLADAGPKKAQILLDAAKRFRELFYDRFLEGVKFGIFSEETAAIAAANKDTYAAFRGLDHVALFVTPMARKALGTLGQIENPFITTLLKWASLNNLIEVQKSKMATRDFMLDQYPDAFKKAERAWSRGRMESRKPAAGLERLEILEDGKVVDYDVDPYIVDAYRRLSPAETSKAIALLNIPFRRGVYPLIIKYNPAFVFALNPTRDIKRSFRNLGAIHGVGRMEYLRAWVRAIPEARQYVKGQESPIPDEMMKVAALGTPIESMNWIDRGDPLEAIMQRYRLTPSKETYFDMVKKWPILGRGVQLLEFIAHAGSVIEAIPKIAAYKTLIKRGITPTEAAITVRNYVGTPNYRIKGMYGNTMNVLCPFFNIFVQGYRSDAKLMRNPKTAGGWWFRWALGDGSRSVLMGLAQAGALGSAVQALYSGISEYDKANYTCIPLGYQLGGEFGRKTVYLRIPRDEVSRLISAATYKLTTFAGGVQPAERTLTDIFSVGAGIVPSVNPVLKVGWAWSTFMAGQNPIDPWRNRPVVPQSRFDAGMGSSLKPMFTWTVEQSGLLNLVRYNPQAETTTEMVLGSLPGINRVLKISDYGWTEQQRQDQRIDKSGKAISKLEFGPKVRILANEHYRLSQLGNGRRTPQQAERHAILTYWYGQFRRADESARQLEQSGDKSAAGRIRSQFQEWSGNFVK